MKIASFDLAVMDYFLKIQKYCPGGNSLNQAIHFKCMGYDTAFIGAVGKDDNGKELHRILNDADINISNLYVTEGKTGTCHIRNDNKGERFGVEGTWSPGVSSTYIMQNSDWDFLKGFDIWITNTSSPNYIKTLEQKSDNQFMAVDFMHFNNYELIEHSLKKIDIAFIGGTIDMLESLELVSKKTGKLVVLTLGAEGSIAIDRGKIYRQKALNVEKIIDTTGCGDAFQAAFTDSYIKNKNIEEALLAGAKQGRKNLEFYGAVDVM